MRKRRECSHGWGLPALTQPGSPSLAGRDCASKSTVPIFPGRERLALPVTRHFDYEPWQPFPRLVTKPGHNGASGMRCGLFAVRLVLVGIGLFAALAVVR